MLIETTRLRKDGTAVLKYLKGIENMQSLFCERNTVKVFSV